MKMKSVMEHGFSRVAKAEIPRSSFDRSHGHKTTFDAGRLIPIFVDEVVPGDTFNLQTSGFCRMATPIYPIMDNMYLDTHYFFVPNRLVWDNWVKMMGEQQDPGDSIDYEVPIMTSDVFGDGSENYWPSGSVADYFGIPTGVNDLPVNALPIRAYYLIWDEWFRDQNLQLGVDLDKGDGPTVINGVFSQPLWRGKRHDYFTSCLPWPQKGDSVDIPLNGTAPIKGWGDSHFYFKGEIHNADIQLRRDSNDPGEVAYTAYGGVQVDPGERFFPAMWADLEDATGATINQLRQAFQVQKMLERDARGGTRYVETIKAHFNVVSPDFRLQRPEFLGGGSSPINITPVPSTAEGAATRMGDLGALGTIAFRGHGFTKSFTEHGYIIGLASVRADLTYQQGLNRLWSRKDRYDFYYPALAHIGEQAVLNKEIYAQGNEVDDGNGTLVDDLVFGYQERFAEMRYKPSIITGEFRSNHPQSLDAWHLSVDFDELPELGAKFIQDEVPLDRVIAATDEPHFIADFYHKLICARPMPMFGTPGYIDRF